MSHSSISPFSGKVSISAPPLHIAGKIAVLRLNCSSFVEGIVYLIFLSNTIEKNALIKEVKFMLPCLFYYRMLFMIFHLA